MQIDRSLSDNKKLLQSLFSRHAVSAGLSMFGVQCCLMINSVLAGKFFGGAGLVVTSIVSPIYSVYAAIGALCGIGGAIITAHALGRGDKDVANESFSCAFFVCVAISVAVSIFGLIFQENLLQILGSSEKSFPEAQAYSTIYITGGIFTALFYMPYHFLKLTGQLKSLILLYIAMAVENFFLDWLFCEIFQFGMDGIALGTVLSSLITVVIGFKLILRDEGGFKLVRKKNVTAVKQLFRFGTPSALNQALNFARFILMNQLLLMVAGQMGLAIFSVVKVIENLSTVILAGISQATSAFVGVFFQERDNESIRQIERQAHLISFELIVPIVIGVWIFPEQICALFGVSNSELTAEGIKIFSLSLIPSIFCMILTSYYQSTKFTKLANLITSGRGFILLLIPAYILAPQFGLNFVWYSFSIAAVGALIILGAVLFFNRAEDKSSILLLDLNSEKNGSYISFSVPADIVAISNSVQNIAEFCAKNNLTNKQTMLVKLSMEEMLVSITEHCFEKDTNAIIDVRIFIVRKDNHLTIVMRIRNSGKLFNPIAYYKKLEAEFDEDDPMNFAMSDSLGIAMISKISEVHYQSTFGINNLTVRIDEQEGN